MAIILEDDVQRLDRLITDISDASRLDAELSRAETGTVDIGRMLRHADRACTKATRPRTPASRIRLTCRPARP